MTLGMNYRSINIGWNRTGNQELMPNKDRTLKLAIIEHSRWIPKGTETLEARRVLPDHFIFPQRGRYNQILTF